MELINNLAANTYKKSLVKTPLSVSVLTLAPWAAYQQIFQFIVEMSKEPSRAFKK
jgi:hypothetical protein